MDIYVYMYITNLSEQTIKEFIPYFYDYTFAYDVVPGSTDGSKHTAHRNQYHELDAVVIQVVILRYCIDYLTMFNIFSYSIPTQIGYPN
jgi:hypothetical protein